jgi:hypothetical protein
LEGLKGQAGACYTGPQKTVREPDEIIRHNFVFPRFHDNCPRVLCRTAFIKHFAPLAANKPYLTLQFDEHGADAGTMTRVEAYLDSKGFLRWWSQDM